MMGGEITIDSEYGQGTTFMIMIPIVEGDKSQIKKVFEDEPEKLLYAPNANVLVVDDNEFNIKVAYGLLNLLSIDAKTAFSGIESIEMAKQNDFDIIFMDHMMPEMDGIEAMQKIRELSETHKNLPIIALTANAVQNAKSMFLASGFDGFLSKPIDTSELADTLKKWLPSEKLEIRSTAETESEIDEPEQDSQDDFLTELNKIEEINIEIGLSRVSGMEDMYHDSLELLLKKLLPECDKMTEYLACEDMKSFSISVHAMKSMLSTVGAMRLSEIALKLETAAKDEEFDFCVDLYPDLKDNLISLHDQLATIFPSEEATAQKEAGDSTYLQECIQKVLEAVDDFDNDLGLEIIEDLLKYDFGEKTNALLHNAADAFHEFNFDEVNKNLKEIQV